MDGENEVIVTVTQVGRQPLTLVLENDLVMGRDCDGLLIADSEVSRQHLRIRRRGRAVEVSDLGSTNGTFRGSERVMEPEVINRTTRYTIGYTDVAVTFRSPKRPTGNVRRATGGNAQATLLRTGSDELRDTSINKVAETLRLHGTGGDGDGARAGDLGGPTLTMVFSDIESSTERATQMGDSAWYALLDRHNQAFRSELRRWGGDEVKSIGDGFMLTFPSVRRALQFAIAIQRRVADDDALDLRVRMGMHTGEAIEDKTGDLFGRHVNMAARIANLATGGQILASLVVREIATAHDYITFGEPMTAELKGFGKPETVFDVDWTPPAG